MFGSAFTARRLAAVALGATVLISGMAVVAPASAAPPRTGPPPQVLERDMRGEAAISALGRQLPEVAAQNDMSPAELRAALREDSMLWVSRTGQLLFVDEFDHVEAGATSEPAVAPLADTFTLHSRPGSNRTIFLDFDGHDARGTAWGSTNAQLAAAYDSDGAPAIFGDAERTVIQDVWARVAEDFAPFDVDVTTAAPTAAAIRRDSLADVTYGTRLVVTPSKPYSCNCGGVAYVGVFDEVGKNHDYYQPAWVFTAGVGNGAKNIAEAASHEIGHNLGLSHDGTSTVGYYSGHASWAPIMGVGYDRAITQWSAGEYSGASNTEDDLVVMQGNGAQRAADDHGATAAGATPLTSSASGVIGTRTDVDAFSLSVPGPALVTVSVQPAAVSPNLDVELRLVGPDGALVLSADPTSGSSSKDVSTGLGAELAEELAAGTYTLFVDGVGFGSAVSTGYSDYGSLGRYTVTTDLVGAPPVVGPEPDPPVGEPEPPAVPSAPAAVATTGGVMVTWTAAPGDETGFEVERETLNRKNDRWGGSTILIAEADATSVLDATVAGAGTFRYRIRAVKGSLVSAWTSHATVDVAATTSGGGGRPGKVR